MQKNLNNKLKITDQKVIFCTECGTELQNFCFGDNANNPEAIRKTLSQCKKIGRFDGDFCSKLFISENDNMEDLWTNDV